MEPIYMNKPTKCSLWSKKRVNPEDLNLQSMEVFIQSKYLKRDLFKCRECGQLYFHEWYEHINFKRDAFMYDTYIPIETRDEIDVLLQAKDSAELARFVPQLHGSHTNKIDDALEWAEKVEDREE